jgi:hypothetical protein
MTNHVQYHDEQTPLLIQNDVDQSALERGSYTGTKVGSGEAHTETITPLPWRPVLVLFMLNMVTPLTYEFVFPFISELVSFAHIFQCQARWAAVSIFGVACMRPNFMDLLLCLR